MGERLVAGEDDGEKPGSKASQISSITLPSKAERPAGNELDKRRLR